MDDVITDAPVGTVPERILKYINGGGRTVDVMPSSHAMVQFHQRYNRAFPDKLIKRPEDVWPVLNEWFTKAKRFKPKHGKYEKRLRRHGEDTLYFFRQPFVFIVQNAALLTVELGTHDTRHLNKRNII